MQSTAFSPLHGKINDSLIIAEYSVKILLACHGSFGVSITLGKTSNVD